MGVSSPKITHTLSKKLPAAALELSLSSLGLGEGTEIELQRADGTKAAFKLCK